MHACKAPETPRELPLAETVTIRNIIYLIVGGGSSHQRTGLGPLVPCSTGKYREIRRFRASDSQGASAFGRKFNRLPIEFPSRLNREKLRAIREPEAGNSEPYPNNGTRCLAPHDLPPAGSNPGLATATICSFVRRGSLSRSHRLRPSPPKARQGTVEGPHVRLYPRFGLEPKSVVWSASCHYQTCRLGSPVKQRAASQAPLYRCLVRGDPTSRLRRLLRRRWSGNP